VKLVERVLNVAGDNAGASGDAAREEIEQLVDAVHCHARTLALLAPSLRKQGVEATHESLVELMAEMEKNFPSSREKSVFASVELSLRRMSQANQDRARVLGVFYGGVDLDMLHTMMQWEKAEVASLAHELIETGLATPNPYNHLTLNPALCPYLRGRMDADECEALTARWVEATHSYVRFLVSQRSKKIDLATTLTMLELPNLFASLDLVRRSHDAGATLDLAILLYRLLQSLGTSRLLTQVGNVRDAAASELGDAWTHTRFEAAQTHIEQQLDDGQLREALTGAKQLFQRAHDTGERAYREAEYDLAMACILLARVLKRGGRSEEAFPLLDEARYRFEAFASKHPGEGAEGMVSTCFSEKGECLWYLGRLDEAAVAYEEGIRRHEELGDIRGVAVGKAQIGSIRSDQGRYSEALAALAEARERFTNLNEPGSVAVIWHQTGTLYQNAGEPEAAEDAYRKSLAMEVRLGNPAGQADTLAQLGILYSEAFGRVEEAVSFFRQSVEKYVEIKDVVGEGQNRGNLAIVLHKLRRLDEARQEIRRAIQCNAQFGHSSQIWKTWSILAVIEVKAGNAFAAAEAKRKAIDAFLAYRRDGGENHRLEGRISLAVTESLLAGDAANAAVLQQLATHPNATSSLGTFIRALQAIVHGSRDRTLADAPDLDYGMATEILFLIETLEKHGSQSNSVS
jgi:tetratricopeptide (TPR) repeat protein